MTKLALFLVGLTASLGAADLTITGVAGKDGAPMPALSLSLDDLAAMPHVKVTVPSGSGSRTYEGVLVYEILKRAGQPFGDQMRKAQLVRFAVFTAHDGYRVLFALPEFDPAFTEARAMVADRLDGKPLPTGRGPLQLVVPGEKSAARSVYMLERVDIQAVPESRRD